MQSRQTLFVRYLDSFFVNEPVLNYLLSKNCKGMDIAVMEGVMGYYDGAGGITSKASAYEVASLTNLSKKNQMVGWCGGSGT